jgi:hypothetical protein
MFVSVYRAGEGSAFSLYISLLFNNPVSPKKSSDSSKKLVGIDEIDTR